MKIINSVISFCLSKALLYKSESSFGSESSPYIKDQSISQRPSSQWHEGLILTKQNRGSCSYIS